MTASIMMVGPLLIHLRVESARKRQGTVETHRQDRTANPHTLPE